MALYQSFQPVFTFILANWFLDEPVDVFQVLGAVIVCIGLFIYLFCKVRYLTLLCCIFGFQYLDHKSKRLKKKNEQQVSVGNESLNGAAPLRKAASLTSPRCKVPTTQSTDDDDIGSVMLDQSNMPLIHGTEPLSINSQEEGIPIRIVHDSKPIPPSSSLIRWATWGGGESILMSSESEITSSIESFQSSFGICSGDNNRLRSFRSD